MHKPASGSNSTGEPKTPLKSVQSHGAQSPAARGGSSPSEQQRCSHAWSQRELKWKTFWHPLNLLYPKEIRRCLLSRENRSWNQSWPLEETRVTLFWAALVLLCTSPAWRARLWTGESHFWWVDCQWWETAFDCTFVLLPCVFSKCFPTGFKEKQFLSQAEWDSVFVVWIFKTWGILLVSPTPLKRLTFWQSEVESPWFESRDVTQNQCLSQ